MGELWRRHGERALVKLLAIDEHAECRASADPARFLAKRFAAKEALGKALGCGMRAPVTFPAIAVIHDDLGKPAFRCSPGVEKLLSGRGLVAHLSISDERDHALAFVVLERGDQEPPALRRVASADFLKTA